MARHDISHRQKTQQMFLTSSPASALSDDIRNRGTFHKTNDYLLFGSLASMVSAVNALVLTGSARDNNRIGGARLIIAQWCVIAVTTHVLQCIFVSCSQHWHMARRVCTLVLLFSRCPVMDHKIS